MSIFERCFLNRGFLKRGQHRPTPFSVKRRECWCGWKHCSGLIAAFSTVCNGYRYTPKAIFSVDDTCSIAICRPYTCVPGCTCMLKKCTPENSQVARERPSLLYDHTNVILRVVGVLLFFSCDMIPPIRIQLVPHVTIQFWCGQSVFSSDVVNQYLVLIWSLWSISI